MLEHVKVDVYSGIIIQLNELGVLDNPKLETAVKFTKGKRDKNSSISMQEMNTLSGVHNSIKQAIEKMHANKDNPEGLDYRRAVNTYITSCLVLEDLCDTLDLDFKFSILNTSNIAKDETPASA